MLPGGDRRDIPDLPVHVLGLGRELVKGPAGGFRDLSALSHRLQGVADSFSRGLHPISGPAGQAPDFTGHHREPGSRRSGPRRFHVGVKGQQPGLECDFLHRIHDFSRPLPRFGDPVHGRHQVVHRLLGRVDAGHGRRDNLAGPGRVGIGPVGHIGHLG